MENPANHTKAILPAGKLPRFSPVYQVKSMATPNNLRPENLDPQLLDGNPRIIKPPESLAPIFRIFLLLVHMNIVVAITLLEALAE